MTSMVHRAGTHQRDRQDLRRLSVLDHVHAAMMLMRSYRCRLNDEADRQRDVQLMTERPWLDVPIVYSDGRRAIITVEKAAPGERALAVLGLAPPMASGQPREVRGVVPDATIEPASENPRVPIDLCCLGQLSSLDPFATLRPRKGVRHSIRFLRRRRDGNSPRCLRPNHASRSAPRGRCRCWSGRHGRGRWKVLVGAGAGVALSVVDVAPGGSRCCLR
jgi:hypothetical protein